MSYSQTSLAYLEQKRQKEEKIIYSIVSFIIGAIVGGVSGVFIFMNITGGSAEPSQAISAPTLSVEELAAPTEQSAVEEPAVEEQAVASETAVPAEESVPAAAELTPTIYQIVSAESEARFSVDETFPAGTAVGRTNEVAGEIFVDFNTPSNSQLGTIRINLRTLATDNPDRDKSIRCCVLLTARPEFEFADFVPTQITGFPEQVEVGQSVELQITGDLTVRGVTNPVTFYVLLTIVSPEELRGLATTNVRRSDFNILNNEENGFDYHGVAEEVTLEFEFVARSGS